jgi:hypothetical protein
MQSYSLMPNHSILGGTPVCHLSIFESLAILYGTFKRFPNCFGFKSTTSTLIHLRIHSPIQISFHTRVPPILGLLNISCPWQIKAPEKTPIISWRECSKKSVQQGRESPARCRKARIAWLIPQGDLLGWRAERTWST